MFTIKKRIYYHDTDCGGVVYYANYLKFFEEARTEHLLSKGIDLERLSRDGILFAVTNCDIQYKGPARYGDELSISSKIEKTKPASLYFYHEIKRDDSLLVECRTRLVSIGTDFKPIVIPQKILTRLTEDAI